MYIPEFVCGILATIGFEFLLLIGCAIRAILEFARRTDTVLILPFTSPP